MRIISAAAAVLIFALAIVVLTGFADPAMLILTVAGLLVISSATLITLRTLALMFMLGIATAVLAPMPDVGAATDDTTSRSRADTSVIMMMSITTLAVVSIGRVRTSQELYREGGKGGNVLNRLAAFLTIFLVPIVAFADAALVNSTRRADASVPAYTQRLTAAVPLVAAIAMVLVLPSARIADVTASAKHIAAFASACVAVTLAFVTAVLVHTKRASEWASFSLALAAIVAAAVSGAAASGSWKVAMPFLASGFTIVVAAMIAFQLPYKKANSIEAVGSAVGNGSAKTAGAEAEARSSRAKTAMVIGVVTGVLVFTGLASGAVIKWLRAGGIAPDSNILCFVRMCAQLALLTPTLLRATGKGPDGRDLGVSHIKSAGSSAASSAAALASVALADSVGGALLAGVTTTAALWPEGGKAPVPPPPPAGPVTPPPPQYIVKESSRDDCDDECEGKGALCLAACRNKCRRSYCADADSRATGTGRAFGWGDDPGRAVVCEKHLREFRRASLLPAHQRSAAQTLCLQMHAFDDCVEDCADAAGVDADSDEGVSQEELDAMRARLKRLSDNVLERRDDELGL